LCIVDHYTFIQDTVTTIAYCLNHIASACDAHIKIKINEQVLDFWMIKGVDIMSLQLTTCLIVLIGKPENIINHYVYKLRKKLSHGVKHGARFTKAFEVAQKLLDES